MLWIGLLSVLVLPLGATFWFLDDWRRDLTTNEAATDEAASDPLLRPLDYQGEAEELVEIVRKAAGELPRWTFVDRESDQDRIVLHFTRRTALIGFTDDILVTIAPQGQHLRLTAHSKSRVGKGDLGQNPRNLRELLSEVRRQIELREG